MEMDDDDEFGDLYADVLRPVSDVPHHPLPCSSASAPNPLPDPLLGSDDDDDDRILYGAPSSAPLASTSSQPPQILAPGPKDDVEDDWLLDRAPAAIERPENWGEDDEETASRPSEIPAPELPAVGEPKVLEEEEARASVGGADFTEADVIRSLEDDGDGFMGVGASEKMEIGDPYQEPVIPGLSVGLLASGPSQAVTFGDAKASGSEDWDSDSEDDLQIVLNDSNPVLVGGERNDGVGSDDDDEDGEEDLVIVTDADQPHHHQTMEEQDWGEEATQPATDGERKETAETGKANGGAGNAAGARIAYNNHGFHAQHHSMYKYIRPGAGPVPGGPVVGTIGGPGQIRPPPTLGPIAGRGRSDWRPAGVRGISNAQRSFNSGYGLPGWANNSSGRPFGSGLDFTLPSYKTVFDIDIESFDEKPWRHPGIDISEFFNFGLDEDNWKDYCKQLEQLRLESTMQSKIRVYESGRSEQDYDPDLPPELAAAAGHHNSSADNAHHCKAYNGPNDLSSQGRGASCIQTPLPIGRAIQVEGGYGERLPSIDTRPPRIRDSDAIIEIALDVSLGDSTMYNGALEHPEKDLQGGDLRGVHDYEEDDRHAELECFDRFPDTSGRKREMVTRNSHFAPDRDGILPFPSESPLQYNPNSKLPSAVNISGQSGTQRGGRFRQGTVRGRHSSTSGEHTFDAKPARGAQVDRHDCHQIEKQGGRMECNNTSEVSPTLAVETATEPSMEQRDSDHDDRLALGDSTEVGDDMASETPGDDRLIYSVKKQKLSSRVEQPTLQDNGDDDDMRTTHSDNSRARSGSSKDYPKRREGGEELIQDVRSRQVGDLRKRREEEERDIRRKDDYGRDGRHEIDRNHIASRGREAMYHSYSHRDWDSNSTHTVRGRSEGFERPKEMDGSTSGRQRREDGIHTGRIKDGDIRRERHDEIGSRNKNKAKVSGMNDKEDDLHLKKRVDDGDWRGRHREGGPRQRDRDDILTRRRENLDDPPARGKKGEHPRRDKVDKEDTSHGYRAVEDSNRRKRERDDGADHRRREDDTKTRDKAEDRHSSKHKDDSWRHSERDNRQRLKKTHEDLPTHREREEGRGTVRNGRATEDNPLAGNAKNKDDSKGMGSDKDNRHQDRRRHVEQFKRADRSSEGNDSQHKGRGDVHAREKQSNHEERSSRHERLNSHGDRPSNASDNQQMHREKYRESTRKDKDIEVSGQNLKGSVKRKHEDHNTHRYEKVSLKGSSEKESNIVSSRAHSKKSHHHNNEQSEDPQVRHSSEKLTEDQSDDENQRPRSKLERWTSHKERDYSPVDNPPPLPSSSRVTDVEGTDAEIVQPDESATTEGNDANDSDPKGVDAGQIGEDRDRHLDDTVAKLKRRSERFKLPMPGDKDTTVNKKAENETQLTQSEAATEAEVKPERPARKRRWTGS